MGEVTHITITVGAITVAPVTFETVAWEIRFITVSIVLKEFVWVPDMEALLFALELLLLLLVALWDGGLSILRSLFPVLKHMH
jgi:hypothetical protein